jgi:myo-inositol-1(or 4)-monophosphatase
MGMTGFPPAKIFRIIRVHKHSPQRTPMSEYLQIAIDAARDAGRFLVESVGKVKQIETKKGEIRNLVSEIDRGAEKMIIRRIRERFPHHEFLAEESGGSLGPADFRWIIDPLDGTTNFLHAVPIFSVTLALERNGEVVSGVTYDPNRDELFTAEKGSGAFLNGERLQVTSQTDLIQSLLVTGFPYDIAGNPDHPAEHFTNFLHASQGIRRLGSAALDLAYVAAGRFDGFYEVALQPWDMAAGRLMVEEAGGTVSDFHGNPSTIYVKQIVASNGPIHAGMLRVLAAAPSASG